MKFIYSLIIIFMAVACDNNNVTSNKISVVVTTGMIADTTRNIGGDQIVVESLMGPGVDPHLYKATANDTKKLANADIIIYNGLHLEGKMTSILSKMKQQKAVFAITEDIAHDKLQKPEGFEGLHDPHIWFSVVLWKEAAQKITKVLQSVDPKNSNFYQKNGEAYLQKLDDLHLWVKREVTTIPKESRVLVTAHDAFGYFGKAYDFKVIGLQGVSTVTESGIQDIERIVKILVDGKIKAIFEETSVIKKGVEAVVEHCKVLGHEVKIGGALFSDAMGQEGTTEGTYIGMVQHNVRTIVAALSPTNVHKKDESK